MCCGQATRCVVWMNGNHPGVINLELYTDVRRTSAGVRFATCKVDKVMVETQGKNQKDLSPGVLAGSRNMRRYFLEQSKLRMYNSVPLLLTVVAPLPPAVRTKPVKQAGSPRNSPRTATKVLGRSAARVCAICQEKMWWVICPNWSSRSNIFLSFQAAETVCLVGASN